MPVKVRKVDGYRVSTPSGVKAKSTTKAKATRQANLLRAVEHGWKPTGKKARDVRKKTGVSSSTDPVAMRALDSISRKRVKKLQY